METDRMLDDDAAMADRHAADLPAKRHKTAAEVLGDVVIAALLLASICYVITLLVA
jgi:hypothetical protein